MSNNSKNNKHTRHIFRRMNFVRNGKEFYLQNTVWFEGGLQLADIGKNNIREYKLNPRLVYAILRLDN